jgi:hypothetical protein
MRRYIVTRPEMPEDRTIVLVDATQREMAKRLAYEELGGDKDLYIVEPLPTIDPYRPRIVWKDSGEVR